MAGDANRLARLRAEANRSLRSILGRTAFSNPTSDSNRPAERSIAPGHGLMPIVAPETTPGEPVAR